MVAYPADWAVEELQDICVPSGLVRGPFGGSLKKEIFQRTGNKVYEQRNAIYKSVKIGDYYITDDKYNEMQRFALHSGDFIISCSGTIGCIYRVPGGAPKGIINQALLKITIDEIKCDPEYFYKYFEWGLFQSKITDDTQGGAMKNLVGMDKFRKTQIAMPQDKNEQNAIAQALSDMSAYIDNLAELIEKKRCIRDGALEELVSGKIEFDGCNIRWHETELHEVAFYNRGRSVSEKNKYVSTENMRQGFTGIERYKGFETIAGCEFETSDTLVANIRPYLKKIWCAEFSGCCSADVLVVKSKDGMDAGLLYYLLANDRFINYVMSGGIKGIKMPRGDKEYIMRYPLLIPSNMNVQRAIANALTAMDEEIAALGAERDKMVQIREGAMDDLLTGRVRLSI